MKSSFLGTTVNYCVNERLQQYVHNQSTINHSLRLTNTVHLVFKIYPPKTVHLYCNKVYLIKEISSTKKLYVEKGMEPQSNT